MNKLISSLCLGFAIAITAVAFAPSSASAQCPYGCVCSAGSCGCNSLGNGSACATNGNSCTVQSCGGGGGDPLKPVGFAPDGSVFQYAVRTEEDSREVVSAVAVRAATPQPAATTRWEYVSAGLSVARNCSGLIVERRYDPRVAAVIRQRDRTLQI